MTRRSPWNGVRSTAIPALVSAHCAQLGPQVCATSPRRRSCNMARKSSPRSPTCQSSPISSSAATTSCAGRRRVWKNIARSACCVEHASSFLQAIVEGLAARRPVPSLGGRVCMIKTKGILHVTITVSAPARSRAFYTDILGLEFVAQVPKENPHFVFLKSGADYVILSRDTSRGRLSDIIHHAFMVDGDAYDPTLPQLKANAVAVFPEHQHAAAISTRP